MSYTCKKINDDSYLIQGAGMESMYLINGRDKGLLIDAGMEEESLKEYCRELCEKEIVCVLTHGHFDHIGKCGEFEEVYLDHEDLELYRSHGFGPFKRDYFVCKPCEELKEMKKEYDLGDHRIISIKVPGHTKGSIILCDLKNKSVYCGDAIGSGCGVLMTKGLGSLPLDEYEKGLEEAIKELESLGVDESWTFYGGHDGQQYHSRVSDYNPLTLKMFKDMKQLCHRMNEGTALVETNIRQTPFGEAKETIGIYETAELQMMEEIR
ncbi:MAG: MBL fold metallo-hydrolase [Erysipelotrichaceae bacterium]|nr:MBL fold metallo-hydrolase [Erysipelotrichaceae bacterium]